MSEAEFLYDKNFECPICYKEVTSKIVRIRRLKYVETDFDLCPQFNELDVTKYDVVMCPHCGFASSINNFTEIPYQKQEAIKSILNAFPIVSPPKEDFYTYEYALTRYQHALFCAIAKKAKSSEIAMIYLRTAWLYRRLSNYMDTADENTLIKLKIKEKLCLKNAYDGLFKAYQKEPLPLQSMDEPTVIYLLAALAYDLKEYNVAFKQIMRIIKSTTVGSRTKLKADLLRERIRDDKRDADQKFEAWKSGN